MGRFTEVLLAVTMQIDPSQKRASRRTKLLFAAIFAVALAAVYGIEALRRNPGDPECRPALAAAKRLASLVHGEIAGISVAHEARRLPDLAFADATGATKTLADWRGRTMLLNLWATWCVPCRKEMPALDALQSKLGGRAFEVVAINIDTRDPEKPKAWLNEVGVTRLAYYADPSAKVFQDLKVAGKAIGMPTTIVVDGMGCEIATLAGPAEWASTDAVRFMSAAIGK